MNVTIDADTLENLISIAKSYKGHMGDDPTTERSLIRFCDKAIKQGEKILGKQVA